MDNRYLEKIELFIKDEAPLHLVKE